MALEFLHVLKTGTLTECYRYLSKYDEYVLNEKEIEEFRSLLPYIVDRTEIYVSALKASKEIAARTMKADSEQFLEAVKSKNDNVTFEIVKSLNTLWNVVDMFYGPIYENIQITETLDHNVGQQINTSSSKDISKENESTNIIYICNLNEQFGDEEDQIAADTSEVRQIFIAIGTKFVVPSTIFRVGDFKSDSPPRPIHILFSSKSDQKYVLSNANKLTNIPKWSNVVFLPYHSDPEKEDMKLQIAQMQKKIELLEQWQALTLDIPLLSSSSSSSNDDDDNRSSESVASLCETVEKSTAETERINETKKVLNILVLGETGVGKSTWINAIANYLSFETLQDALMAEQPICVIPAQFTYFTKSNKCVEVKLDPSHGEKDENEIFSDQAQSTTQEPKIYQFETSKYIVNIIDTPGIGDTRGVEQDKENTRKILNTIRQYQELHAICFLFGTNETRMSLSFRYCISELLLQLHKNAANNINFIFTNARGTNYKPGHTMIPLSSFFKELHNEHGLQISLESNKIYCTDNEAFRLLCAHYNGKKLEDGYNVHFEMSWKQSAAETYRLFEAAAHQLPYYVSDTITIDKARIIISHLAKPLADVNELIESNIKLLNDRKKNLANTANNLNDLKKKLKGSQIMIEVKQLPYPRTVCTSQKCIEMQKLGNTEQFRIIYKQICHDQCQCSSLVDVERVPDPRLQGCAAMAGTENCQKCGCHWNKHMHIRFDQIKTCVEKEDETVKDLIAKNENAMELKEKMIKNCEININTFKAEQEKIMEISIRFALFLKANAILPYSDAFEKYVERSIEIEENFKSNREDRTKLNNLIAILEEYRRQKALLMEPIKDQDAKQINTITPDEIDVMKLELFGLKKNGRFIENLFHATEEKTEKNIPQRTVKCVQKEKHVED